PQSASSIFRLICVRPPSSALFPYPTLFRSLVVDVGQVAGAQEALAVDLGEAARIILGAAVVAEHHLRPVGDDLADLAGRQFLQRSEEHTSELQSRENLVCRLLLEKKYSLSS